MRTSQKFKQTLKQGCASALFYTGITSAYSNHRLRGRAAVLMYHRVTDTRDSILDYAPGGMDVTSNTFKRQMQYLKSHFNVITFSELCEILRDCQSIPPKTCVITFDDGWRDNFINAYPVLKELELPATIFIAVNYVNGGKWYWLERFRFLLAQIIQSLTKTNLDPNIRSTAHAVLISHKINLTAIHPKEEMAFWLLKLGNEVAQWDVDRRENLLKDLEALYTLPSVRGPRPFLNWDEIQIMAHAGIEIGSHTLSHRELDKLEEEELETELAVSKRVIESKIKKPVTSLAYPYGKNNSQGRCIAAKAGYLGACSTRMGLVNETSDLFALERIPIHNEIAKSTPMFACRMMRFMNMY